MSQDEAHEMMDDFRKWLKANDDEGLTMSQVGFPFDVADF